MADLCPERHPEQDVPCRLSADRHADHIHGFGPDLITWPADPAIYSQTRVERHKITDLALKIMKQPRD